MLLNAQASLAVLGYLSLVFAKKGHIAVKTQLAFTNPFPLFEHEHLLYSVIASIW